MPRQVPLSAAAVLRLPRSAEADTRRRRVSHDLRLLCLHRQARARPGRVTEVHHRHQRVEPSHRRMGSPVLPPTRVRRTNAAQCRATPAHRNVRRCRSHLHDGFRSTARRPTPLRQARAAAQRLSCRPAKRAPRRRHRGLCSAAVVRQRAQSQLSRRVAGRARTRSTRDAAIGAGQQRPRDRLSLTGQLARSRELPRS